MKRRLFLFLIFTSLIFSGDFPIKEGTYQYGLTYITITKHKDKIAVEGQIEFVPTDSCMKGCASVNIESAYNPEKGVLIGKMKNDQKFKLIFVGKDIIKVEIDSRKPFLLRPTDD